MTMTCRSPSQLTSPCSADPQVHGNLPTTPSRFFSPHAADRHKWGGFRVLEVSPLGLEDGVQPFCATVMQFPTTEQNPTEQLLVPEILPKPAVDISVLISAVNKQRKVSLDLCHCLKEQNWLKKEVKLLPYDQVARHCLGFARLFLLG